MKIIFKHLKKQAECKPSPTHFSISTAIEAIPRSAQLVIGKGLPTPEIAYSADKGVFGTTLELELSCFITPKEDGLYTRYDNHFDPHDSKHDYPQDSVVINRIDNPRRHKVTLSIADYDKLLNSGHPQTLRIAEDIMKLVVVDQGKLLGARLVSRCLDVGTPESIIFAGMCLQTTPLLGSNDPELQACINRYFEAVYDKALQGKFTFSKAIEYIQCVHNKFSSGKRDFFFNFYKTYIAWSQNNQTFKDSAFFKVCTLGIDNHNTKNGIRISMDKQDWSTAISYLAHASRDSTICEALNHEEQIRCMSMIADAYIRNEPRYEDWVSFLTVYQKIFKNHAYHYMQFFELDQKLSNHLQHGKFKSHLEDNADFKAIHARFMEVFTLLEVDALIEAGSLSKASELICKNLKMGELTRVWPRINNFSYKCSTKEHFDCFQAIHKAHEYREIPGFNDIENRIGIKISAPRRRS